MSENSRLGKSKAQILRDRAIAMARRPNAASQQGELLDFLEFQVAFEKFGVESSRIQEVAVLRDYTRLPSVPRFVMGIMNLRGRIISILDLKQLFSLPRKGLTYHNKVIVIRNDAMTLGLLADEILGLRTVPLSQLQPALPTMTGKQSDYLKGITSDWASVLDAEKILSDKNLIVRDDRSFMKTTEMSATS